MSRSIRIGEPLLPRISPFGPSDPPADFPLRNKGLKGTRVIATCPKRNDAQETRSKGGKILAAHPPHTFTSASLRGSLLSMALACAAAC